MQKIFMFLVFFIALILMILLIRNHYHQTTVFINGYKVRVDEALTPVQQRRGLAVKNALTENQGMLFIFNHEQPLAFWMKDMQFPIDIIWLDSHCHVVHVEQNLPPCPANGNCPSYLPAQNAQYVLEVIAGFAQKHQIIVGQTQMSWPGHCGN